MAGNVLKDLEIKKLVCSPLRRAIQTAFLAKLGLSLEFDDNLTERDFGQHEGKLAPLKMFEDNYDDCEDTAVFSRRVAKALEHAQSGGTLLVSHGGVLRVIAGLLGVELREEHLENGCVLHFHREGSNWKVDTFRNSVVLVSGANRGIGPAIAKDLIARGYRLSLGARDIGKLEQAFGSEGEQLHYARFDAEKQETMKAWVEAAVAKFGRIDGLVNNAGAGASRTDNLMSGTDKELAKVMTVNCIAPWHLTQLCMPHLEKTRGRIVYIDSLSGLRANKSRNFIYNASKFAETALADTVRWDSWDRGVRVTAICSGWVATEMSAHSMVKPEDMTQPEDIAKICQLGYRASEQGIDCQTCGKLRVRIPVLIGTV